MKLMTKEHLARFAQLGSQERKGLDAEIVVKFFTPWTSWTWYATEWDPRTGLFFGLVDGHTQEMGYFSLTEMEAVRGPFGLKIERDLHFTGHTVRDVFRGAYVTMVDPSDMDTE